MKIRNQNRAAGLRSDTRLYAHPQEGGANDEKQDARFTQGSTHKKKTIHGKTLVLEKIENQKKKKRQKEH